MKRKLLGIAMLFLLTACQKDPIDNNTTTILTPGSPPRKNGPDWKNRYDHGPGVLQIKNG
jgi:hypothetical protein